MLPNRLLKYPTLAATDMRRRIVGVLNGKELRRECRLDLLDWGLGVV